MITGTGRDQLTYTLHQGDCLDVLATLDPESVDCVVEDPPAGIGFMGKPWDSYRAYQPRTQKGRSVIRVLGLAGLAGWEAGFVTFLMEAHVATARVMKPGAYMLTWALPKTADLSGLALRLAGLEVCDSVLHLFGSGMAKAGDLGKKIDKMLGAEREVVGKRVYAGGHVQNSQADRSEGVYGLAGGEADDRLVTAPATPEAERWTDWSSQLAPGHEQWILARKPTPLTYAAQVLRWGCGALNVGGCRVPRGDGVPLFTPSGESGHVYGAGLDGSKRTGETSTAGSLPKNVILTTGGPDCPVAELDRQSGVQRDNVATKRPSCSPFSRDMFQATGPSPSPSPSHPGPGGGASRYYTQFRYQAKARDRDVPGDPGAKNRHPTHKHPELMRWLVRLVCPPGGRVLDPFMGSGTTGVAAAAEGCHFTGVEQDLDSSQVAQARVAYAYQAIDPEAYSPKRAGRKPGT